MHKSDTYNGSAWRVTFFDGFHNTTQVILGESFEIAKNTFESQTGFIVQMSFKIQ
ncbi:hypothetical protein K08M3_49290 [Vibrio alginolyticus]|jgi:hypothetical protein|uniref:Uncharacterized protein n=1 Tax=Vibrio alginolyticus TaxID=663 RepID=A0A1W6TL55_VIBAL|nr:hypothetical protein K04M1_49160 [Vibrio alginolyticus]MDG2755099.1 hypothetical protein [Vibrio parahaemolyticus]ARP11544.1 hypothetical protein K04M3_49750 [Vibrio alginolyticus]ARP16625.1 hypothetical protein K04M5_49730 [Vibrio alginolyticus]ARP21644.1 hypothetical protein K05K4_49350 [Vibrio alginolyticus]